MDRMVFQMIQKLNLLKLNLRSRGKTEFRRVEEVKASLILRACLFTSVEEKR